jgi:hypothetical protein
VNGFEGDLGTTYLPQIPAISIQTMASGRWVTCCQFYPKEYWAEGVFDIKPYLDESRLVRLIGISCNAGKYHEIDYAALDTSPDRVSASLLDPIEATINDRNVLPEIGGPDGSYALLDEASVLTVSFSCSQLKDDARDFILVSRGYYEVIGHTFYLSTWDGNQWNQRDGYTSLDFDTDTLAEFYLGRYLPDAEGRYRI